MAYCLCNVALPHKQNTIVFCFVVATRPVVAYHIGTLHPSFGPVRQPSKNITNSPPPCTLCIAEQNAASQVFFLVSSVLAHPHEAAHPAVDRADIWKGYTGVSLLWKLPEALQAGVARTSHPSLRAPASLTRGSQLNQRFCLIYNFKDLLHIQINLPHLFLLKKGSTSLCFLPNS